MTTETDPTKQYQEAIEAAAQQLADTHLVNAAPADWQISERAMAIAREKRAAETKKGSEGEERRRLENMNNSEFAQELRKYGIW